MLHHTIQCWRTVGSSLCCSCYVIISCSSICSINEQHVHVMYSAIGRVTTSSVASGRWMNRMTLVREARHLGECVGMRLCPVPFHCCDPYLIFSRQFPCFTQYSSWAENNHLFTGFHLSKWVSTRWMKDPILIIPTHSECYIYMVPPLVSAQWIRFHSNPFKDCCRLQCIVLSVNNTLVHKSFMIGFIKSMVRDL